MHTSPRTRGPTGTHADPRTRGPGTPRTRGPADRPGTPRGPQKFPTRRIATQGPRTHPRTLNWNSGFAGTAHWPLKLVKNPSSIRCLGKKQHSVNGKMIFSFKCEIILPRAPQNNFSLNSECWKGSLLGLEKPVGGQRETGISIQGPRVGPRASVK